MVNIESIPRMDCIDLVERFQNGELKAFDEIVSKYQQHVYSWAYCFTQNCEDAYDISQEVFIKVFRSLNGLKNSSAFNTWLRRVTINACTDFLRRQVTNQILDLSHVDKHYVNNTSPGESMETEELKGMISKAVDQLPKRQRKVFVLRYYKDMPLKDIAEALNCSLGTVKAHLSRATRRLRSSLLPFL